jgi:hypothetical protein
LQSWKERVSGKEWWGRELEGGGGGRVGREREESKSQLEGVFFFFLSFFLFFKWNEDYRTLSPTEGIFHLLLSDSSCH